jgi:hypothetical protein
MNTNRTKYVSIAQQQQKKQMHVTTNKLKLHALSFSNTNSNQLAVTPIVSRNEEIRVLASSSVFVFIQEMSSQEIVYLTS